MTSFSRMRISVAVNGSSTSIGGFRNSQSDVIFAHAHIRGRQRFVQPMESVLNVGLYFEKMGFYSQCHIKTCLYSLIYIQNTSYR